MGKNKAPYDAKDIIYINSSVYDYECNEFKDVLNFIDDNHIVTFKTLTKKLRQTGNDSLLMYVSKNCYYVSTYIIDSRNEIEKQLKECKQYITDLIQDYELNDRIIVDDKLIKLLDIFKKIEITE